MSFLFLFALPHYSPLFVLDVRLVVSTLISSALIVSSASLFVFLFVSTFFRVLFSSFFPFPFFPSLFLFYLVLQCSAVVVARDTRAQSSRPRAPAGGGGAEQARQLGLQVPTKLLTAINYRTSSAVLAVMSSACLPPRFLPLLATTPPSPQRRVPRSRIIYLSVRPYN